MCAVGTVQHVSEVATRNCTKGVLKGFDALVSDQHVSKGDSQLWSTGTGSLWNILLTVVNW